jgi:hypothetical protein
MGRAELERVREWALAKIATGDEPPWSWYQHMKLREALDAILAGMDAITPRTENSPQEVPRPGTQFRLVGATFSQDTVRHHPSDEPELPM